MGVCKVSLCLVLLAATTVAVSAQSPEDVCEISGGTWSDCASACPLTCANFQDPPLACIQLCVVGCTCPAGLVLNSDGECVTTFGCITQALPSPSPSVSDEEQICESSGGVWSDCASACPLTCDNFQDPPLACPQVCVVGCTCSSGKLLNSDGKCVNKLLCDGKELSPLPVVSEEQQICEFSGGLWSSCASACPLTCDTLDNPPFFCPQSCAVGCTCPEGFVLDLTYGCKAESFCEPTPCCEALTSECLACSAGVPEDQYCKVNPETPGCISPPADLCASVECGPDQFCDVSVLSNNLLVALCVGISDLQKCGLASPTNEPCELGSSCNGKFCICDDILPGDANNDGSVQVNDIVLVVEAVLGTATLPECIFDAVDLAENGALTVADVVVLVETIVG